MAVAGGVAERLYYDSPALEFTARVVERTDGGMA